MVQYCHRSSITEELLNSLDVMIIEDDILQEVDFQDLKYFTVKYN